MLGRLARDAQEARRLDVAWQRRRTEAGRRRNRGGVGPLGEQPCGRMVRIEEGSTGKICHVRPTLDGSVGAG